MERALELADGGQPPSPERVSWLGEGWTAEEAVAIALYAALVGADFRDAMAIAVDHSGDSDSTGALTGNLLGAVGGETVIPQSLVERLELRSVIETIALDLARFRSGSVDADQEWERYPGW